MPRVLATIATCVLLGCAHPPKPAEWGASDRELIARDVKTAVDFIRSLPECEPGAWEEAAPAGAGADGGLTLGRPLRLKGVLAPTLSVCTLLACIPMVTATTPFTSSDVEGFLTPQCCNECGFNYYLVDDSGARVELRGLRGPVVNDCSDEAVQDELRHTPLVVHGAVTHLHPPLPRAPALAVQYLCRGPARQRPPEVSSPAPRDAPLPFTEALLRYARAHPGTKKGEAAYLAAVDHTEGGARRRALLEQFLADFPRSKERRRASVLLAAEFAKVARLEEAAATAETSEEFSMLAWAAQLREAVGDEERAASDLQRALAGAALIERPGYLRALAELRLRQGRPGDALPLAREAAKVDLPAAGPLNRALLARVLDQLDRVETAGIDADTETEAAWHFAEPRFRHAQAQDRAALLQTYDRIIASRDGATAAAIRAAAHWRRGLLLRAEGKDEEALLAFASCLAIVEQAGVWSQARLGCRLQRDVRSPFPPRAPPGNVEPARLVALEGNTAEQLLSAGLAFLAADLPGAAVLALQRALQVREEQNSIVGAERRAPTAAVRAALAWALLRTGEPRPGEPQLVAFHLDEALREQPTSLRARANRAALRCRFGEVKGAREDLALIPAGTRLEGADVDPTWERCREKEPTW